MFHVKQKEREENGRFFFSFFYANSFTVSTPKQQPNLPENQLLLFEWRALPSLVSRVLVR